MKQTDIDRDAALVPLPSSQVHFTLARALASSNLPARWTRLLCAVIWTLQVYLPFCTTDA